MVRVEIRANFEPPIVKCISSVKTCWMAMQRTVLESLKTTLKMSAFVLLLLAVSVIRHAVFNSTEVFRIFRKFGCRKETSK
jgi:hypothetical protein